MTLYFPAQPAFVAGKISPRLYGRIDLDQYTAGLEECTNFVVYPHGGATFRTGTKYVDETKVSANQSWLLPFVFSNTQAYAIEAGASYFRFFTGQAFVEDPGSPGNPLEVVHPYTYTQLTELKYAQSADVMNLVHNSVQPKQLNRLANDDWTVTDLDFQDGPYYNENTTETTLGLSATSGSVTVTASAVTGINSDAGFASTDVGRLIRFQDAAGNWTWLEITAWTDTTHVTATIRGPDASGPAQTTWRMGAWSDTDGWPEAVAYHQQRLFFARGQYIWGSRTGDFAVFAPTDATGTVIDDDAVTYRLAVNRVNEISWLASGRQLEVGTEGAEFTLAGTGQFGIDSPLTPDSVLARKAQENGSIHTVIPVFTANGTVFLSRTGKKLYNYYYSFQSDNYITDDLTLLSEDITAPTVKQLTYAHEPNKIMWAARSDGTLLGCTFYPQQDVIGWHEHVIGGTDVEVESVTAIPASDGTYDELYMIVKRTVNSQTVRYIEVMTNLFQTSTAIEDACFVDCSLTYSGAATTSITGLTHLEGETVTVFADGVVHPDRTVASGAITLQTAAEKVHVGLSYQGVLQLLPFEPGDLTDAMTSRRSRIVSIGLKYYQTVLAEVGVLGNDLETFNRRTTTDPMDTPLEPEDGFAKVPVASNSEYLNKIRVEQNYPLPCTILSILPVIEA